MHGQTSLLNDGARQVEAHRAALSKDVVPGRGKRFLWTGLGVTVILLIGVSTCDLSPLAPHASAKPSRPVSESATIDAGRAFRSRLVFQPLRGRASLTNLRPAARVSMSDESIKGDKEDRELWRGAKDMPVFTRRSVIDTLRVASFGALAAGGYPQLAAAGVGNSGDQVGVISKNVADKLVAIGSAQADLFQNAVPSVCFISTDYTSTYQPLNPNVPVDQLPTAIGSGFVWDKKGHIVTNFHVINKADGAVVTLTKPDGSTKKYKSLLTGIDPDRDIAVLKIDAPEAELEPLPIGDSANARVGEISFAIGNPFGQEYSLTSGIISGKNRNINAPSGRKISGVLQTDAAINPGNSGGPLLDARGRVVGINTANLGSGTSAGVGFAVPIDLARPSIEQLIQFGQVRRATLGITYADRQPSAAEAPEAAAAEAARQGIPYAEKGIVVLKVIDGSPAQAAGIIPLQSAKEGTEIIVDGYVYMARPTIGDVIVAIGKDDINGPLDLPKAMSKYMPGDIVDVKVLRGRSKEPKTVKVKLGALQRFNGALSNIENERGKEFAAERTRADMTFEELPNSPADMTPQADNAPATTPK